MQFNLQFKNSDHKSRSILLPGSQNKGNKIVYLSFFKVDEKTNFYTEIAKENRAIEMHSPLIGTTNFDYLRPGENTTIPIFFNDKKNYYTHTEAHHAVPNLPAGEYEVLAWYYPWDDSLARHVFQKISVFDKGKKIFDTTKFNIPEEGLVSNYTHITIVEKNLNNNIIKPTEHCPQNCSYCAAIEENNWQKVAQIIDRQTHYNGALNKKQTDSTWCMPHKNLAWVSDWPDAILSSLPSSISRQFIFSNSKGYHYFNANWQLGIIYPAKSRIQSIGYYIFRKRLPITTSNVDYMRLTYFAAW